MVQLHDTASLVQKQQSIYPAPFLVQPANLKYDLTCHHASTYTARVINSDALLVLGITCKRWSCRPCAQAKIRRLAVLTKLAAPNRLLTLTVDPSLWNAPRDCFLDTSPKVAELTRSLRTRFGEVEYLRVTELTKKGWPHYHLLVRSGYLPHPVVKAEWNRLTGAQIVDLKQVNQSFKAYYYLTKYLSKLHSLQWTDRHVSYSKHFFPKGCNEKRSLEGVGDGRRWPVHPFEWLANHCMGLTITQNGPLSFSTVLTKAAVANTGLDGF